MNKIRVCIIGFSYGQTVLLKCLNQIPNITVIGVAINKRNAKTFKKEYPSIIFQNNYKTLINETLPQFVVIATPTFVQVSVINFLLSKKIPFFCEKPLSTKFSEAQQIYKLVTSTKLPFVIDYNFLTLPIFVFLKSYLKTNNNYISYEFKWNFRSYKKNKYSNSWKFNTKLGGGTLNNYGSHVFSIVDNLFGEIIELNSKIYNTGNLNDDVIIKSLHKNATKGTLELFSSIDDLRKIELNIYYKNYQLKLINKTNDYHNGYRLFKIFKQKNKKLLKKYYNYSKFDSRITQTTKILKSLVNLIIFTQENDFNIEMAFRIQKLIDCAFKSNTQNKNIKVK